MAEGGVETVQANGTGNGSLGTRRLVVSHVENAASFYAYIEAEAGFMKEILETCRLECSSQPALLEAAKKDQVCTGASKLFS